MSMFHRDAPTGDIHQIHQWTYADAAAKAAAAGFASSDVGKVALQEDTQEFYILTDESPITWIKIGDPSAHIADATAAHAASAISFSAGGTIAGTDLQTAVAEVATDAAAALSTHEADTTSIHGITDTAALVTLTGTQALTNKDYNGGTASDTSRFTLSKNTTANLNALTRKEGNIFYDTDRDKAVIDNGASLVPIGSGSGGALNLLTLTSAYAADNTDNADAESSVGGWTSYADAAATTPVDMTGGTPGSTAPARSTSSPLNGTASIVFDLGSGSSRQGEGMVSGTVYVPPGYRGLQHAFRAVFEATGALVDGDIVAYAYDITNAALLAPTFVPGKILGSKGEAVALFDIPSTCAQLRIGFHVARTSTGALSLKFDDLKLTRESVVSGLNGCSTQTWTPVTTWVSNVTWTGKWRQVGDFREYEVHGAVTGAPTAAELNVTLPTGHVIDTTKLTSTNLNSQEVGTAYAHDTGSNVYHDRVMYQTTTTVRVQMDTSGAFYNSSTPHAWANGDSIHLKFSVPIAGLDANVTMAASSTFKISSYLANGSRVTATPTALGQYRTVIKDNAAGTFSDTDGSGEISLASGMRIYSTSGTGAGTSTDPNRWEIFVGKNKNVRVDYYASANRTGFIDTKHFYDGSASYGLISNYDPTTGVVSVAMPIFGSGTTRKVGQTYTTTTAETYPTDCYFDIVVSENALAVGVDPNPIAQATGTATGGGSAGAIIIFPTKVRDNSVIYSTSTGQVTANRTGWWRVSAYLNASNSAVIAAYVNGVSAINIFNTVSGIGYGSNLVYASAGQTIDIRPSANLGAWGSGNYLTIEYTGAAQ